MDMMHAGAVPSNATLATLPHGLSLKVMKKGMEAQEQQAMQMLQEMMPPTPGKGQYIDVYA